MKLSSVLLFSACLLLCLAAIDAGKKKYLAALLLGAALKGSHKLIPLPLPLPVSLNFVN